MLPLIKKGDFVMMQFGANQTGPAAKTPFPASAENTESVTTNGLTEDIHSSAGTCADT